MNFATALLPGRIVDALGWTLFHSLWQGALAALAFALVLYLTRQYSARVRYALGLMALLLALAASIITFLSYYGDHSAGISPAVAVAAPAIAGEAAPALPPAQAAAKGERSTAAKIASFFSDYFGRNLPLFVTLWLLGVLFLTLRFAGGLLYVQRLKYRQSRPLPGPWPEKLRELAGKAGLRRPIQMLESLRLRVPVVVGHLKPVLLLPAGLVTGLPADEVEALLAHELAHVMRRDYLVNVLQHLLDILFFFHPGIRWISACVRQEREHCCDDFAVELCGDPQNYARALARLEVEGMAGLGAAEPALAAIGPRRGLLRRIARLLASPRLAHDFREGFVSAMLLVVGLLGILRMAGAMDRSLPAGEDVAPAAAASRAEQPAKAPAASRFALVSFVLEADGLVRLSGESDAGSGGSPGTWLVDDSNGQVIWYMELASRARKGGKASFGEEVSLGRGAYSWYRPAGWKVTAQWKGAAGRGAWEPLTLFVGGDDRLLGRRGAAGERLLMKEKEREEALLKAAEEDRLLQERAETEAERQMEEEKRKKLEQELQALEQAKKQGMSEDEQRKYEQELQQKLAQAEAEQRLREEESQKLEQELKENQARAEADLLMRVEEEGRLRAEEEKLEESQLLRVQEKLLQAEAGRLKIEEGRLKVLGENLKKFTAALAEEGLINIKEGYKIKLSPSSLVINGKRQPQKVFEKYRQFYETLVGTKLDEKHKQTVTFVSEKE